MLIDDNQLVFIEKSHFEYRKQKIADVLVIRL